MQTNDVMLSYFLLRLDVRFVYYVSYQLRRRHALRRINDARRSGESSSVGIYYQQSVECLPCYAAVVVSAGRSRSLCVLPRLVRVRYFLQLKQKV